MSYMTENATFAVSTEQQQRFCFLPSYLLHFMYGCSGAFREILLKS